MQSGDVYENNYFVHGCSAKLLCCEPESAFPDPPLINQPPPLINQPPLYTDLNVVVVEQEQAAPPPPSTNTIIYYQTGSGKGGNTYYTKSKSGKAGKKR